MDKAFTIDILLVVGYAGGVEQVVNRTASFLLAQGHRVRVVQIIDRHLRWTDEGIPFYPLLERKKEQNLGEFLRAYTDFLQLPDGKENVPDLVLACGWPYTAYIAKKALTKSGLHARVISWIHNPMRDYIDAGFGTWESLLCADAHFAISREIENSILQVKPDAKVIRVYNPVDFSGAVRWRGMHPQTQKKNLYVIGRLTAQKNQECALRALTSSHASYHLTLIGDGAGEDGTETELKTLMKRLGLSSRVTFAGWQKDPWEIVTDPVAVLIPSRFEGFSLVAVEALSRGIPVIGTPVGILPEVIQPGVNGFLFPQDDDQMLAKILDAVSDGLLPEISPQACIDSVAPFEADTALRDFLEKTERILSEA